MTADPTARPVDAVLFDLGQVLVRWDPYLPFVGRYPRGEVEAFFAEIDFMTFNHLQDAGRSWADARAELARTHPHRLPMLDCYVTHFAAAVPGPVDGADAMVDDLRALGIRVLGLTNWSAQTFPVAPVTAPVVARLEGVVVSGREGIAKPDPAVFELAVARFGLDRSRTVFTDDSLRNVEAAARVGLLTEHFTDHRALRRRLRARGVPLPDRAAEGPGEPPT